MCSMVRAICPAASRPRRAFNLIACISPTHCIIQNNAYNAPHKVSDQQPPTTRFQRSAAPAAMPARLLQVAENLAQNCTCTISCLPVQTKMRVPSNEGGQGPIGCCGAWPACSAAETTTVVRCHPTPILTCTSLAANGADATPGEQTRMSPTANSAGAGHPTPSRVGLKPLLGHCTACLLPSWLHQRKLAPHERH